MREMTIDLPPEILDHILRYVPLFYLRAVNVAIYTAFVKECPQETTMKYLQHRCGLFPEVLSRVILSDRKAKRDGYKVDYDRALSHSCSSCTTSMFKTIDPKGFIALFSRANVSGIDYLPDDLTHDDAMTVYRRRDTPITADIYISLVDRLGKDKVPWRDATMLADVISRRPDLIPFLPGADTVLKSNNYTEDRNIIVPSFAAEYDLNYEAEPNIRRISDGALQDRDYILTMVDAVSETKTDKGFRNGVLHVLRTLVMNTKVYPYDG